MLYPTCSCLGFFNFSLPLLYPSHFSKRSKNLKDRENEEGLILLLTLTQITSDKSKLKLETSLIRIMRNHLHFNVL